MTTQSAQNTQAANDQRDERNKKYWLDHGHRVAKIAEQLWLSPGYNGHPLTGAGRDNEQNRDQADMGLSVRGNGPNMGRLRPGLYISKNPNHKFNMILHNDYSVEPVLRDGFFNFSTRKQKYREVLEFMAVGLGATTVEIDWKNKTSSEINGSDIEQLLTYIKVAKEKGTRIQPGPIVMGYLMKHETLLNKVNNELADLDRIHKEKYAPMYQKISAESHQKRVDAYENDANELRGKTKSGDNYHREVKEAVDKAADPYEVLKAQVKENDDRMTSLEKIFKKQGEDVSAAKAKAQDPNFNDPTAVDRLDALGTKREQVMTQAEAERSELHKRSDALETILTDVIARTTNPADKKKFVELKDQVVKLREERSKILSEKRVQISQDNEVVVNDLQQKIAARPQVNQRP